MHEITSRDPSALWRHLLEEAGTPDTLVLVDNLLMERQVRTKWQRYRKEFAPDIRTLASFLEEPALHSLDEEDLPRLIPTVEERALWLEQWLSTHGDPDFRRFAGMKSVTAISNIIGQLYRENHRPGALQEALSKLPEYAPSRRHVLADLLVDYERQMTAKKWLDREHLPGKIKRCNHDIICHKKLVLYLIDELEPVHERVINLLASSLDHTDSAPGKTVRETGDETDPESGVEGDGNISRLVSIRFEEQVEGGILAGSTDVGNSSADATRSASNTCRRPELYVNEFHHPRQELEQAVRQILHLMAQKNGSPAMPDRSGLRFDDFVILTGDLSAYESMTGSVGKRFDVPLYTSRGPSLISHPFVRRLLTYLKLEENDFQIDDVFRVFADNRLALPDLQNHDEEKPPNIRHFSQFCRAYNFRTLKDAAEGMDRVYDALLDEIRYEADEEKEQKRREGLRRDRDFYTDVIWHLQALRHRFRTGERQSIKKWVTWAREMLDLQKDLMSLEGNQARQLLGIILDKLSDAQERLGLTQNIGRRDFFNLLELRLKETRERPDERPGGVLLTEIRHLPEVHDKIVFILGLHEDGFPGSDRPDFLQFRYEKALQHLTGRKGTESYDLARLQLQRLLASGCPRFLSKPKFVAQKQVMPSPLWLELMDEVSVMEDRSKDEINVMSDGSTKQAGGRYVCAGKWPVCDTMWLMSDQEIGLQVAKNGGIPHIPQEKSGMVQTYELVVSAENRRQDPDEMGPYDGVTEQSVTRQWREQQESDGRVSLSISRLDSFAGSPQEYFFKYVLRLRPLHEYQDDAESNIKGSLLHHILEDFYSETAQEGPPVWPEENPEAARDRMNRIRNRLIGAYRHQLGNPESPFPGILEKNLERVTRGFIEREIAGREDWLEGLEDARPAVFYSQFGFEMEHRWKFEKELAGVKVSFQGKIDRMDLTPDGRRVLIYDYKSGKSGIRSYDNMVHGRGFQLPVYGMYVREKGIEQFLTGYYHVPISGKRKEIGTAFALGSAGLIDPAHMYKNDGKRKRYKEKFKPKEEMDAFMEAMEERRIAWIVRAIRDGRFHVSLTGELPWSDFRHITRHDVRIQLQRSNREQARRRSKGMTHELDRYYLAEPFWEDDNNVT